MTPPSLFLTRADSIQCARRAFWRGVLAATIGHWIGYFGAYALFAAWGG